jgi:hypothetical protein
VYPGEMGRNTEDRCKEHTRHICLGQPQKSAVAEHRVEMRHSIHFSSTAILDKAPVCIDNLIKEAVEVRPNPINFNWYRGFNLSWSWYPVSNMIKQHREQPIWIHNQDRQSYDFAH